MDKSIGLRGIALAWIHSYLEGRSQQVQVGEATSTAKQLKCGVPQGSILGPTLYCLYTRQIGRIFEKHGLAYHCYADDSQVYTVLGIQRDWQGISVTVDQCMEELQAWMASNKLKLNQDKFEYHIFHRRNTDFNRDDFKLEFQTFTHTPNEVTRNLGVMFDECMTMERQISAVTRSCYHQLRSVGRIRRFLDKDACRTIVNTTVTSRLDYANALLFGVPDKRIWKLQMVQNSAARLIEGTKREDHITPVLFRLHWLPVEYRIRFKQSANLMPQNSDWARTGIPLSTNATACTTPPRCQSNIASKVQQRRLCCMGNAATTTLWQDSSTPYTTRAPS